MTDRHLVEMRQRSKQREIAQVEVVSGVDADTEFVSRACRLHVALETGVGGPRPQFEGARNRHPQLLGSFRRGEDVRFLEVPEPVLIGFDNYVGSVTVNRDAGLVAISSPKGGQWAAFDVENGKLAYEEKIAGVCGLAVEQPRFVRSTENGEFGAEKSAVAWDNHITRLV